MQPGQQKITQFDEVTSTQSGDVIPIVRGGQNKKISVENFTGVLPEGWQTPAEAWTFASFGNSVGVITIPEGNINRYPNGTRVWFKQGTPTTTNRYGVVIASTTTTLTVAMIADTVLSNLTIQQPAISSEVAPRTSENVDFTVSKNYYLTEMVTTEKYYDGRPIYKKTVQGGALPNATTKAVAHGVLGSITVVKIEGVAFLSPTTQVSLPFVNPTGIASTIYAARVDGNIEFATGQNRTTATGEATIYFVR